jgi:fumarylacetoacetase
MKLGPMLVAARLSEFALPVHVGDYTDFYSSLHHAMAVGKLFRPSDPLSPNYKWLPIGYHGRASSVVVSGTPVIWPSGQRKPAGALAPDFGPSRCLDYEAELGIVIGRGNALGAPVALDVAEKHIAGVCILNDWSARDIQSWEYQPLGPFLGKSFATTLSPWIVTLEALAPFRLAWPEPSDPVVLPYLRDGLCAGTAAIDVCIATRLGTSVMRTAHEPAFELARSSWADAYWTASQLVAHHTSNGCNLRPGDVLGTGTLSGPLATEAGSLLELTAAASRSIALPNGQQRRYLELGDCIEMTAFCESADARRIGFGYASGVVTPFEHAFAV